MHPREDVTQILAAAERGDPDAAGRLLPLVYDELRRMAARKLSREPAGQTLQATALVHEVYLRLVDVDESRRQHWNGRGHFFAAAAEAMRRILIENARRRGRVRHGGGGKRLDLDALEAEPMALDQDATSIDLLALDEALTQLEAEEPAAAAVVKLRYFAGMTIDEAACAMDVSAHTANRH